MSTAEPEFLRLQRAFARHLRDPDHVPSPPGQDERRLGVYRYAVYANVERFMRDNYPRVRAVMSEAGWHAMVRDYLVRHVSTASAFVELPREFLAYLDAAWPADPELPFLPELAHFDWLETLVGADTRVIDMQAIERDGSLLDGVPVANPVLVMATYAWPVHAINADYRPTAPPAQPTRIAAFRDRAHEYGFLDLNPAAARLLECVVANQGRTGREIITALAGEMGYADVAALVEAGGTILARMHARDAILGAARR